MAIETFSKITMQCSEPTDMDQGMTAPDEDCPPTAGTGKGHVNGRYGLLALLLWTSPTHLSLRSDQPFDWASLYGGIVGLAARC